MSSTIVLVVGAGLFLGRWRLDPVRSGSMAPDLPVGSAVIAVPERFSELRPGQIIIFHAPDDDRVLVHRVVDVSGPMVAPVVRTKGDANAKIDPWKATLSGEPVWRVRHVIPLVGQAIQWGRSWFVRLAMLLLAAAGLLLSMVPTFVLKDRKIAVETM